MSLVHFTLSSIKMPWIEVADAGRILSAFCALESGLVKPSSPDTVILLDDVEED